MINLIGVGVKLNNWGITGITSIALISSFLIVGGATSAVVFQDTEDLESYANNVINDALDEISTYLKIEEVIGKYYTTNGERTVEKIVIFVKQYIPNAVNVSDLTIKLQNKNDVMILGHSGFTSKIDSGPLFEQEIWENTKNSFSVIVNIDNDRSLLDNNIMNKDTCYIAIRLPEQFYMGKNDEIKVSIIPYKGIISSAIIQTPSIHISNVIVFGDA